MISIAGLQFEFLSDETASDRLERVISSLNESPDVDVLVLPELWDVAYFAFDNYGAAAQPLNEGPLAAVSQTAAALGRTVVAGSVLERVGERLFNTIVVLSPSGTTLGAYRKRHLFGVDSQERVLLTPGTSSTVVDTPLGRVGLSTCFDLRFPDQFAEMRHLGADIVVTPAAWPATRSDHWDVLLRARAMDIQTPVIGVNGMGDCAGTELGGGSAITDAEGTVTSSAVGSGWFTGEVDPTKTENWRTEFPLLTN